MRVPLSWLQEYIDLPEEVSALRDLLTFAGLEVEGVETLGADLEGFRAAVITAVEPHPNADRLTLCTIDAGGGETLQVVCGAPNAKAGLRTIYAPVGTRMPDGSRLKRAKIRGVESLGMLCAEDELGISEQHDGIITLPDSVAPGTPAAEIFGGPEVVFELEITPNRPDCLSLIGVARELAALTGRELRLPEVALPLPVGSLAVEVDILAPEDCPRYTALPLQGATVAPSPEWMRKRLQLAGVRPINNLVDITNYVMLETGQPLHAFDLARLQSPQVSIRRAAPGEILQTLDGNVHELAVEDLVIADSLRALALAGVMGGAGSEILPETSEVLLESAAFHAATVRATTRRRDTHSESSYRFARGCDLTATAWAGKRAAALICELAGARPAGPQVDVYPGRKDPLRIRCEWNRITGLIGTDIAVADMRGFFQRLGLKILQEDAAGCELEIPGHRGDLTRAVDLTEEIARLNGLDRIPVHPPVAQVVPSADDREFRLKTEVWQYLAARGFLEAMHYSLSSRDLLSALDPLNADRQIPLPNPITQDQSVLRSSLLPQLVESLAFNKAHQTDEIALFESGTVYLRGADGVEEAEMLSLGGMGPWFRGGLDKQRPVADEEAFLRLKGEVEQLACMLRAGELLTFEASQDGTFAPGQSARILWGDLPLGRIGLLHPRWRQAHKLSGPIALAEVNLDRLVSQKPTLRVMRAIPAYPAVSRDIALILPRSRTHAMVMAQVNQSRPTELEDVRLFDVYRGDKLGPGEQSLAYRFTYRSARQTLTDEAVERMHQPMLDRLLRELDARIEGR